MNENRTTVPAAPKAIRTAYYYKLFRVKLSNGRVTTVSVDPALAMRACQVLGGPRSVGALVRKAALEYTKTPEFRACSRFCQHQLQNAVTVGGKAAASAIGTGMVSEPPSSVRGHGVPKNAPMRFYGTVALDSNHAKKNFVDVVDEVVLSLTAVHGVKVRIKLDIEVESPTGFDEVLQRAVRENCKVLRFRTAAFE